MKYAVIPDIKRIQVEDKAVPRLCEDQVLLKVKMCGICGTDVLIYSGRFSVSLPYSPGHEFAGEVVEVGSRVGSVGVGDRVAVDPNYHCGSCHFCIKGMPNHCKDRKKPGLKTNGGFAEYCAVPQRLVHLLPEKVGYRDAVLIEPLSCAMHMVDTAGVCGGSTVVIIGCGTMGLLSLVLCKRQCSCFVIVSEPAGAKRELAEKLGADRVCSPEDGSLIQIIRERTPYGADVVLDNVGAPQTIEEGLSVLAKRGKLVLSGIDSGVSVIPCNPSLVTRNKLSITGAWLNPNTFAKALRLIQDFNVDLKMILGQEFGLSQIENAFHAAMDRESKKVIVSP